MPQPRIKVRVKKSVSGRGFNWEKGEVFDLPTPQAEYWFREGVLEEYSEPKQKPITVNEVKTEKKPVKAVTRPVKKK